MPKSTEPKDGSESDTNLFNICILFLFWPYLANPIYRPSNVIVLMKRSLRPLISILRLVALAATLSCWIVYPRCGVFIVSTELESTKLLERDFSNQGRQRNFATSRSFSHHDAKSRNSNGLLVLLKSPNWCNFPFFLFFFSSYSSPA
ncbi:hypothetical protein ES332_D08G184600v1 [Gossypium tomentosum]|uniref:Uncharacterized protein n=1 Tax=Gossypium tomentosum TaxID=34277 RepID=A0A5D2JWK0_GOSTO|nr:hypothetical protein ES332_D08G184600v1 [Gossypium tomentosum]